MDLQKFIHERPYLYHLTSEKNTSNIIKGKTLYSANTLIDMSDSVNNQRFKSTRRLIHQEIGIKDEVVSLRDQRPISEKALAKCLTHNWTVSDFLHHLNDRVFMWPTLERLWRHFNRYEQEKPIIFRFSTREIIDANPHVKFCRLNSGATRANSYLGGKPPERGKDTFMPAHLFNFSVRDVAEVTFEKQCLLAGPITIGTKPDSIFTNVD